VRVAVAGEVAGAAALVGHLAEVVRSIVAGVKSPWNFLVEPRPIPRNLP